MINEYYGSTEMGNVTFCTAEEWLAHPGTVGRALPGAEVKVVGAGGEPLPARGVGEVIGRMHGMSEFTYQNDHAKRLAMEKQGLITPGVGGTINLNSSLSIDQPGLIASDPSGVLNLSGDLTGGTQTFTAPRTPSRRQGGCSGNVARRAATAGSATRRGRRSSARVCPR